MIGALTLLEKDTNALEENLKEEKYRAAERDYNKYSMKLTVHTYLKDIVLF